MPNALAHQGGWDEILLAAGPVLVVFTLIWFFSHRARLRRERDASSPTAGEARRLFLDRMHRESHRHPPTDDDD